MTGLHGRVGASPRSRRRIHHRQRHPDGRRSDLGLLVRRTRRSPDIALPLRRVSKHILRATPLDWRPNLPSTTHMARRDGSCATALARCHRSDSLGRVVVADRDDMPRGLHDPCAPGPADRGSARPVSARSVSGRWRARGQGSGARGQPRSSSPSCPGRPVTVRPRSGEGSCQERERIVVEWPDVAPIAERAGVLAVTGIRIRTEHRRPQKGPARPPPIRDRVRPQHQPLPAIGAGRTYLPRR